MLLLLSHIVPSQNRLITSHTSSPSWLSRLYSQISKTFSVSAVRERNEINIQGNWLDAAVVTGKLKIIHFYGNARTQWMQIKRRRHANRKGLLPLNNRPNSLFMLIVILHIPGLYKVSIEIAHEAESLVSSKAILNEQHCEKSDFSIIPIYWMCYILRLKRDCVKRSIWSNFKTIIGKVRRVKMNNAMKGALRNGSSEAHAHVITLL